MSVLDLAQGKTEEESQGAIERSLELFDQALQCDPQHVQATYNHGIELWRSGRAKETVLLTQLEEVRKTRPDSWEAAYCPGLVHLERADVESAVKALEEAVRLGGGPEANGLLARARTFLEQTSHCVRTFQGHFYGVNSVCCRAMQPSAPLRCSTDPFRLGPRPCNERLPRARDRGEPQPADWP